MMARSRNGEAMPSTDEATMIAVTLAIARRWGRKRRPMRRSDTLRAWAFSAGVTVRVLGRGANGAPFDGIQ